MRYPLRYVMEYALLRVVTGVLGCVPYRVALGLAWVVALLLQGVAGRRVREARRRIREVFGDTLTPERIRWVAWRSLRNLCFNVVEVIRLPRMDRAWADRHVDQGNLADLLARHVQPGQGYILVIPHMGNWDLAAIAASLRGLPVFVIAARQKNPLSDDYLNRLRASQGMEVVLRDDHAVKRVLRGLKSGRCLAFLTDLRSRTAGMQVQFLGKTANLVAGLGLFARQAEVPVFPGYVIREGWGQHRWHFEEPIRHDPSLDKETDWRRITQQAVEVFDRAIRQHPDQYFWYNKRWVLDPWERP